MHRTHEEECFNREINTYAKALEVMENWAFKYNYERPHSSLNYLTPSDYYMGEPDKRLLERKHKLDEASKLRKRFWLNNLDILKVAV